MLKNMMMESWPCLLAVFAGVVSHRRMNLFYRLLLFQLIVYLILYSLSYKVTEYQLIHKIKQNNHWVFNIVLFTEASLLLSAGLVFFKDVTIKKLILLAYGLFAVSYFAFLIIHGVHVFNNLAYTVESVLLVMLYTFILYHLFVNRAARADRTAAIFASLGIVVFFAGNLPFFSMFNFLNANHLLLSQEIHRKITENLSLIRYLFLMIGFLFLLRKNYSPSLT